MVPKEFMTKIAHLPLDVVLHILSYTYRPQPADLLVDIRDFVPTKAEAAAYFYQTFIVGWNDIEPEDKHWFANELYCYIRQSRFRWICAHVKQLYGRTVDAQINVLWGMMAPSERHAFLTYLRAGAET